MKIERQIDVLLVEDDPGDARLVSENLRRSDSCDFNAENAKSLNTALEILKNRNFDVILLDLSLPDSFGTDTVKEIDHRAPDIPIIVLTGAKDETIAMEAIEKGAQDYLIKGEAPTDLLIRTIRYAIYRKQSERKLTETIEALKDANRQILAQQKSVIEEERLKVLLQMAGTTAHELNQPIMGLLGTIEIMGLEENIPQGWQDYLDRLNAAGQRIASIVKKISTIRSAESKAYTGGNAIIHIDQQITVLVVEDSDADYENFKGHLAHQASIGLQRAPNVAKAMELLKKKNFDLVFMDYLLPDGNGLTLLNWISKEKIDVPVISVTGYGDEIVASQMIKAGAFDYLPKASIQQESLTHCIANVLEKYRLKKEVERATEKMAHMATRDSLTGLFNRHYMSEVLDKEFRRALRYRSQLSCLLCDLDYFKEVNDTHGHSFGDFVLQTFAQRIKQHSRKSDICFRYGGEEFMVLLPQTPISGAREMAEKIRLLCETAPYDDGKIKTNVTVSIGIAAIGRPAVKTVTELVASADKALYQAKAQGRNRVNVYQQAQAITDVDIRFKFLKESLQALLEKTKKTALESLEVMSREMGGERFNDHNSKVVRYLELLGNKMNLGSGLIKSMQRAATLHDLTKVLLGNFYDKVQLNSKEKERIENHPYLLSTLVETFDLFETERTVMLWHHENYDGSGYPDGLKGDEIPLAARIFGMVDAMAAMISHRRHRKTNTIETALSELTTHSGTQFDPMLVTLFKEAIYESALGACYKTAQNDSRNLTNTGSFKG